jgi:hypothetical protein
MTAGVRQATIRRNTAETQIDLTVNLDGTGASEIDTGVPFFDHMLTLLVRHALLDLTVKARGDTAVDYTTPSRMSASCWARRSRKRSATRPASAATVSSSCRWTRRSRAAPST